MKRAEGREGYTADNTEGIRWWRKSSRQSKRGFSSHVHTWKIFRTLDCLLLPRNSDIFTRIRAKEGRGMRDREKGCCEPVPPLSVERKIDINCCFSYSLSRLSHRSKRTSSTFRVFRFAASRENAGSPTWGGGASFSDLPGAARGGGNPWRGCQNARKLLTTW